MLGSSLQVGAAQQTTENYLKYFGVSAVEEYVMHFSCIDQQPVDPVVPDPVRQDVDKIYEYWEVLSPPSVYFNREFPYMYLYIVSLVVILSNWVCDNWVYRFFLHRAFPEILQVMPFLVDVSNIFHFVPLGGRGRGSPRRRQVGAGVGFLLKMPGGGGNSPTREGGGRGAGRVSAGNFGGGAKFFFFSGPKCPPSIGNSWITFDPFIFRELFLVIRLSWFTSNIWTDYFSQFVGCASLSSPPLAKNLRNHYIRKFWGKHFP